MGERVPMMRGMPINEGGLQKIFEVILGTSSNAGSHEHSPPKHCLLFLVPHAEVLDVFLSGDEGTFPSQ